MKPSAFDRQAPLLAACFALASILTGCTRRDPDAVERWKAWEEAAEIAFVAPEDRRDEAVAALPRLRAIFGKPLRLLASIPPATDRSPLLVWNDFTTPLARPSIAWEEPLALNAALQRASDRPRAVFWAWASAERGLLRRYFLVARALDEVPWELLRVERHTGAGYQCFQRGELHAEGPLAPRGDAWLFENLRALAVDFEPPYATSFAARGIRVESARRVSAAQRTAIEQHLQHVVDPFARGGAPPPEVRLVLHRDAESMLQACGRSARELVERGSQTVHWIVGAEPFVLPSCFELQKLRLEASSPSPPRSWWLEGVSSLLVQRSDAFAWTEALALLALDASRPRARDLFDESRFAELPRWQRRAASALLIFRALAERLDVFGLAQVGPEAPRWPWFADQILDHGAVASAEALERNARDRTPLFARTVSIEPAFPRGYFDARYRAALERARFLGVDTVLLVLRDRPAEQSASSRAWPRRDPLDEMAHAAAEAHRAGFRVRVRLRWQELRIGGTFGGIWNPRVRFWTEGLQRYARWAQEVAFASRAWRVEALHVGFELHGMFEPTRDRPPELYASARRVADAVQFAAAVPVIFEFKSRERFGEAAFFRTGERIAVGTRDYLHGVRDRVEPLLSVRDPRAARFAVILPNGPSQYVSQIAMEDGLSGVDLIIGVHGHARGALYPQWPLPGAASGLQQFVLDADLWLAFSNPMVRGVILEGGESEGDHAPIELGFGDPALAELLQRSLRRPSLREALRWILPLAG